VVKILEDVKKDPCGEVQHGSSRKPALISLKEIEKNTLVGARIGNFEQYCTKAVVDG
jgi:hypothetical protein